MTKKLILLATILLSFNAQAQVDNDQLGAWYMYFWNADLNERELGFQGDIQYRNWDIIGDLEQLLLRGGVTYKPFEDASKFTLGYANITTGTFGDGDDTTSESRIYQEALLPHKIGKRFYLTHRFRYEQRFVGDQDFRTRYRYNLFLNIPLKGAEIVQGTWYIALYNELFINGEKKIGEDRSVELFDRNRLYGAVGYKLLDNLKIQLGVMRQTLNGGSKNQLQLSAHHNF